MLQISLILYVLLFLLAFPTGLILAHLCKEEIKSWKKRLIIISLTAVILILIILFLDFQYKISVVLSLLFIVITDITIVWKSKNT